MSLASTVRDRVLSSSPAAAAQGAFEVINALQEIHPARQVLALAAALKLTADVFQIDPRELLGIVSRMEAQAHFDNQDYFSAVTLYVEGEIKRKYA